MFSLPFSCETLHIPLQPVSVAFLQITNMSAFFKGLNSGFRKCRLRQRQQRFNYESTR